MYDFGLMLPCVLSVLYGGVGCIAFFSSFAPLWLHQFYVLANCSLVSLFYLRSFPGQTAWFVLGCVAIWDIFAVMSPIGPLRKVQEKAGDYSQDILRFMMFTASNDITTSSKDLSIKQCDTESKAENDSDSYCEMTFEDKSHGNMAWEPRIVRRYAGLREPISTNKEFENQVSSSSDVKKFTSMNGQDDSILYTSSAASALNDSDSLRLGMGDFVFYSVLVGQAATSGSFGATFAAAVGVIYGLCITLVFFTNGDETTPALPISILLGSSAYFSFLTLEPFVTSYIETLSL